MISLKKIQLSVWLGSLCTVMAAKGQPVVEKLWLTEGLSTPESALVYSVGRTKFLLVSQIDGDLGARDGKGGIAKMDLDGDIDNIHWVVGLNSPQGMAYFEGKLYVADINELVVIDIKSAVIEQKIVIPGAQFLNDVTIDTKGRVYISDTKAAKVYRYQNHVISEYLTKVESANGLTAIGSNIVVGSSTHLYVVDESKNRLQIATGFAQMIDGVEALAQGNFLVSCWPGLLYYVHLDGKLDVLLDSQKEGINIANIGFDSHTQTVFVPNLANNSVTAYKVIMNELSQ